MYKFGYTKVFSLTYFIRQNGPTPRSCHKICFDEKNSSIYVLGRYVEPDVLPNYPLENDFWRYDVSSKTWKLLSRNTVNDGGPELIYDHQMVIDSKKQNLFVFGGRIVGIDSSQANYSGLYVYSIAKNSWKLLRSDTSSSEAPTFLKSRIGHTMLLNETSRELFIFAGQRNKDYLADFYAYNIDTEELRQISRDYSKQGGPDAGFTQRTTMDFDMEELYVFSGLTKEKNNTQETVKNSLWVYNIKKEKWSKIYQNENTGTEYWNKMCSTEPCPRFAHQLVYDYKNKIQYLFGGNPGENGQPNLRLDDFWQLALVR
jgi:N-acetylneuraminic acid mutarotase